MVQSLHWLTPEKGHLVYLQDFFQPVACQASNKPTPRCQFIPMVSHAGNAADCMSQKRAQYLNQLTFVKTSHLRESTMHFKK